jgi:hypothetical protein
MLTQLGLDHYERLAELDANRAREVSRIQNALAEQAAAKQRIIALVARGKISDHDADDQLDVINAEEARLHGQLNTLETNRNLAGAYLKRIREAEATIKDLRSRSNLDLPEDRRRAIEVLLQEVKVRTIGIGRQKRAELTFCWLGQEPYTPPGFESPSRRSDRRWHPE